MVIKDIGSCCFRQAPELTYLPVPVQPSKAFLPHLYSSQPLPRYLPSASTAISSDGRKPHCTMVKTSPEGDKCYAFCPPSIYCQAPHQHALSSCPLLTISVPSARHSPFFYSENQLNCWFLLMFSVFPSIFSDGWCSLNSSTVLAV